MATTPKTICPGAGCHAIVESGTRCPRHQQREAPARRETTAQRGYGAKWQRAARNYLASEPLCVPCLLVGRTTAAQCVDHIVPRECVPELFWDADNWCAMCGRCHGRKTRIEPRTRWTPRSDRLVICGLPGTGKTTLAHATGLPYWDADLHCELRGITDYKAIQADRDAWIARIGGGPMVVIVASPTTASQVAAAIQGRVRHCTTRHTHRTRATEASL